MGKIAAVIGSVFGVVVLFLLLGVFGYVGFSNTANKFEVDIKAKYSDNQNVYDNGWKKVMEVSQVPALQTQALKDIYDATMKGRYGADGSKALFQFIKEQNPTLDQTTFIKVQQDIESFRTDFASNQTRLVSIKQQYETFLSATTSGRFYNMIGSYPHIDLSKFDIVTSAKTQNAFETKQDEPLQIAPKK